MNTKYEIHTEEEIQEAANEVFNESEDHLMIVVLSNADKSDNRRVSIFNGSKRVYCCDWPRSQACEGSRYLTNLLNQYDCTSRQICIDMN